MGSDLLTVEEMAQADAMAVEAGVSDIWRKYVGLDGVVVGIDRFGISAPGDTVMSELGISVDNVVKQAALAGLSS